MKRTLVISDIHGCIKPFNQLLEEVNYKPDVDKLILLGDYIDRGRWSKQVVSRIMELSKHENVVALLGNHDQMFIDVMRHMYTTLDDQLFINHGGMDTVESYTGEDCVDFDVYLELKKKVRDNYSDHIDFLKTLQVYHETETHIFAHAGINPNYPDWKFMERDEFTDLNRNTFFGSQITNTGSKTVVFGHTPTININEKNDDIYFAVDRIGIDGGYCFGGQLNCLVILDDDECEQYHQYQVKSNRFQKGN